MVLSSRFSRIQRLHPIPFGGQVVGMVAIGIAVTDKTERQRGGPYSVVGLHLDVDMRLRRITGVAAQPENGAAFHPARRL